MYNVTLMLRVFENIKQYDNFRNILSNLSIKVSVCRGSYDGYVKHKK